MAKAMGKKGGLHDVLAKGKEALEAARETPVPSPRVSLNAKLPGGLTLKGFMAQNNITREEAERIYEAYTKMDAEDEKKIALRGLPATTPASASGPKSKAEKEKPEKPSSSTSKKRAKESTEAVTDKKLKLDVVPFVPNPAPRKSVKRVLFADELAVDEAANTPPKQLTRASKKRPPNHEEAKIHRSNANPELATPTSSPARPGILKRGWLLGFACRYCLLQFCSYPASLQEQRASWCEV